VYPSSLPLRRR